MRSRSLLALGVLNVVKGLDFEEALWSFAAAALLWWGRSAFHVRHDPVSLRSALLRVPAILAGAAVLIVASIALAAPASASFGQILRASGDAVIWQPGPIAFKDDVGHLPLAVPAARPRCAADRRLPRLPAAGRAEEPS